MLIVIKLLYQGWKDIYEGILNAVVDVLKSSVPPSQSYILLHILAFPITM